MTESEPKADAPDQIPEAIVEPGSSISIVWIIPLVAALIGGWLAYKAWSEKGPTITISFKTAEGLEADTTKIKYKNVEIGIVDRIGLSDDLSHVIVSASLIKNAERYLTENTRFWVVRARVAAGEVSALGTLLSGAYIGIDPGSPGDPSTQFKGLETAPVVTNDLPGRHYTLRSHDLGSLDMGSPVYYRKIKVGQVISHHLENDGQSVTIEIFVNEPYHSRITKNSRFWNASGLDFSVNAGGIKVDTESLITMLIGGIAFDTPLSMQADTPAEDGDEFILFQNRDATTDERYLAKTYFVMYFSQSVRGLAIGAPVEFRGIKIGEVTDIKMEFDIDFKEVKIPVMIALEPARFDVKGNITTAQSAPALRREILEDYVNRGLRAQLKTGNYLTGQLYIDLDINRDAIPKQIVWNKNPPEFPTIPAPLEEITNSIARILDKLEKMPLENISMQFQRSIEALASTMKQTEQLTRNLNFTVAPAINETLEQTKKTLAAAEKTMSVDSPLQQELNTLLDELSKAVRSIRIMADYLERHPDALIYGKRE